MEKKLKEKIDLRVKAFKDELQSIMLIDPTQLNLGVSMIKRFLYRLSAQDAQHLITILEIIRETDAEDLNDIIEEAIAQYTTPEQKPFVNAIMDNDKIKDLLETGKLNILVDKFSELLKEIYAD